MADAGEARHKIVVSFCCTHILSFAYPFQAFSKALLLTRIDDFLTRRSSFLNP